MKITKILFADYNRALIRTWKIIQYCKPYIKFNSTHK